MKKILFSLLCMLAAGITHAQSQVGIIRYTLPEGWYARKSGDDIVLERKGTENSGCSVTLFQEISSVVSSEKEYAQLWGLKTKTGNTKIGHTNPAVKTEEDGWISFSGSSAMGKSTSTITEGFYTLSDGSTTVMILAQAEDGVCIDEVDSILATVHIPEKEPKTNTRAKRVRVAALKSLKGMVN